MRYLRENR